MKLAPVTWLIIAMFGSFTLILGSMVVIFRPDPPPVRRQVKVEAAKDTLSRPVVTVSDTPVVAKAQTPETPPPPASSPKTKAPVPQSVIAGREMYRKLEREQKEMTELRVDMERRLKAALAEHNRKLIQLARRCEPLEPGEAAEVLMDLSDADIAVVLKHIKKDKAASVAELLKRNGREIKR